MGGMTLAGLEASIVLLLVHRLIRMGEAMAGPGQREGLRSCPSNPSSPPSSPSPCPSNPSFPSLPPSPSTSGLSLLDARIACKYWKREGGRRVEDAGQAKEEEEEEEER